MKLSKLLRRALACAAALAVATTGVIALGLMHPDPDYMGGLGQTTVAVVHAP